MPDDPKPPTPPPTNPPPPEDRNKVAELTAKLTAATTALEGLKSEYSRSQVAWGEERAGLGAGLDSEGLSIARLLYGGLPADKRPAFDAFLAAQKTAPSKALSPWFAPAAPPPIPPAAAVPPPAVAPPAPPALPAPGGAAAGAADAIIQEAIKTGDWSKYNAIRSTLIRPAR